MSIVTVTSSPFVITSTAPTAITITVSSAAGPVGLTGATGESGINRVYYGTGSPPSPVGEADGALFFKYS